MSAIHRAQAGLISDMDSVADVLYGRAAKRTAGCRLARRPTTYPASTARSSTWRSTAHRAIAIVGAGAILPDAPNVPAFWENVKNGRYSITEVPPDRWDPALYYDPDPAAPDKTYSKIGGWVREFQWDPLKWKLRYPTASGRSHG